MIFYYTLFFIKARYCYKFNFKILNLFRGKRTPKIRYRDFCVKPFYGMQRLLALFFLKNARTHFTPKENLSADIRTAFQSLNLLGSYFFILEFVNRRLLIFCESF